MINGARVPLFCPTHAQTTHLKKNQALPPSPSSLAAKSTMGAAEPRRGAADRSDRGRRGDSACGRRADQHRLSGDPKADRCLPLLATGSTRSRPRRGGNTVFRTYSTGTIPPELLAALAQSESSGNPVERTYWRWRWSFNPFAIYQPASSAVSLFHRLRVRSLHSRDPEPCHRTRIRISGPQCGRGPRPRGSDSKHSAEAGCCGLHPSLRRRPRHSFRPPQVSNADRRRLRRSPRRGLCLQSQRNEAPVPSPCGRRRELERSA
jgi:hypothetical protein